MSWGEYLRWVLAILNLVACAYLLVQIRVWKRRIGEANQAITEANQLIADVRANPERYK